MTDQPIRTRNVKSRAEVLEALKAALDLRLDGSYAKRPGRQGGWTVSIFMPVDDDE